MVLRHVDVIYLTIDAEDVKGSFTQAIGIIAPSSLGHDVPTSVTTWLSTEPRYSKYTSLVV